ncbi:glycosyltransferase [Paenibacillus sp. P36]|uniref:glycosyltransferase family protein n=1 Tax=Paenibacillus sp. P36 TaxID=3342538 RepID=UPI0038B37A39
MDAPELAKPQPALLMCYGKTPYTPGRYLEDALRRIGVRVVRMEETVDFAAINMSSYLGVLFVESPSRPKVLVKNIHLVTIPKLFWIHHGENRLNANIEMCGWYKPDLLLMAHSLHLAHQFPSPVRFFPFGVDPHIFHSATPLVERPVDISFVGGQSALYRTREARMKYMETELKGKRTVSFNKKVFLHDLSSLYGKSKIVFNHTADSIKAFNMRIFEGMGCGALVFSDYAPEQEMLFQDRTHFVLYQSRNDLMNKIDYYLNNLQEAQLIAGTAQNYVRQFHTYDHRAAQIINWMKKLRA